MNTAVHKIINPKTESLADEGLYRVLDFFTASLALYPDSPAFTCGDLVLTYAQLDAAANQLADYLSRYSVGPNDVVGLHFKRSVNPIIAMLAVLKRGAAYVPIDPYCPEARAQFILRDAEITLLLTDAATRTVYDLHVESIVDLTREALAIQACATDFVVQNRSVDTDLCYIIYTSGSTGNPKGVMLEQRSVVNYIYAMQAAYQPQQSDKIYHGFSHSFDASVEEIWLAFASGAHLIMAADDECKSADLAQALINHHQITVLSTVPTFLSCMHDPLISLRLIILGGEKASAELLNKWVRPTRRIINSYGPTEATVVATYSEYQPNKPVTIGKPLLGYATYVVDEQLNPVAQGEAGELCISGVCLARGYKGLEAQTQRNFIPNHLSFSPQHERLYRTGDLVKINAEGNIEFIGRIDSQVKIRGFRVELSEIEAVLLEHPTIQLAAVNLWEDAGIPKICAYVVLTQAMSDDMRDQLIAQLKQRLPAYMIPTYLDVLNELPVLASGKIDRKQLPAPSQLLVTSKQYIVAPRNEIEANLWTLCCDIFNNPQVSIDNHFFDDLGGHSLLAAQYATLIRQRLGFDTISIRHVYDFPNIALLATQLTTHSEAKVEDNITKAAAQYANLSRFTRATVPVLQLLAIFFAYSGIAAGYLFASQQFTYFFQGDIRLTEFIMTLFGFGLAVYPALLCLLIISKWAIIGRYKVGEYPVWGFYYLRWWVVTRMHHLCGLQLLNGTPFLPMMLRALGATIGRNSTLDTSEIFIYDQLTIGDNTSIGADTHLLGYRVEDGLLKIGKIQIGADNFIGTHSAVGLNCQLADQCRLEDYTSICDNQRLSIFTHMAGSPARESEVYIEAARTTTPTQSQKILFGVWHLVALVGYMGLLFLSFLPSLLLILNTYNKSIGVAVIGFLCAAPLTLLSNSVILVAVKKILLPHVKPGIYSLHSLFYIKKWLFDSLMRNHRTLFISLYATQFLPHFLRLLGANIGKNVEISTVAHLSPDLMQAGDNCFFADGAIIGGKRIYANHMHINHCTIGSQSFIGNSAMLPNGSIIGSHSLVGCLSLPSKTHSHVEGSTWLGSPPISLSTHQHVDGFDDSVLFTPSRKLKIGRTLVELLRVLLPIYLLASVNLLMFFQCGYLLENFSGWHSYLLAAFCLLASIAMGLLSVIFFKHILIGEFKPTIKPLWSLYIWLNEVVNALYEMVYAPLVNIFLGTPAMRFLLRGMGCRIGKNAFIETTLFSEFDLVRAENFVALNLGATIQTHLFEDRIMKSDYLTLKEGASVNNLSVVLYGSTMHKGAQLAPLSLLMKGDSLAADTRWAGIPTQIMKKL